MWRLYVQRYGATLNWEITILTTGRRGRAGAVLGFVAISLFGCTTISRFPHRQPTALTFDDYSLRSRLRVIPVPLTLFKYMPIAACSYTETHATYNGSAITSHFQLSVNRWRDHLWVKITSDGLPATATIGDTGKLYDFDFVDPSTGQHVTPETYRWYADREDHLITGTLSKVDRRVIGVHSVNEFTLMFPKYLSRSEHPGDIAAFMFDKYGVIWGAYRYRGIAVFHGKNVAVFDLTKVSYSSHRNRPIVVGFNIVDPQTMVPLVVVFDAGWHFRIDQIACSK